MEIEELKNLVLKDQDKAIKYLINSNSEQEVIKLFYGILDDRSYKKIFQSIISTWQANAELSKVLRKAYLNPDNRELVYRRQN